MGDPKPELFELSNGSMQVTITNYGATITSLSVPDKNGSFICLFFVFFIDYAESCINFSSFDFIRKGNSVTLFSDSILWNHIWYNFSRFCVFMFYCADILSVRIKLKF